jgi:hypothetical protein
MIKDQLKQLHKHVSKLVYEHPAITLNTKELIDTCIDKEMQLVREREKDYAHTTCSDVFDLLRARVTKSLDESIAAQQWQKVISLEYQVNGDHAGKAVAMEEEWFSDHPMNEQESVHSEVSDLSDLSTEPSAAHDSMLLHISLGISDAKSVDNYDGDIAAARRSEYELVIAFSLKSDEGTSDTRDASKSKGRSIDMTVRCSLTPESEALVDHHQQLRNVIDFIVADVLRSNRRYSCIYR